MVTVQLYYTKLTCDLADILQLCTCILTMTLKTRTIAASLNVEAPFFWISTTQATPTTSTSTTYSTKAASTISVASSSSTTDPVNTGG